MTDSIEVSRGDQTEGQGVAADAAGPAVPSGPEPAAQSQPEALVPNAGEIVVARAALWEVRDLLMERAFGNPARSPAHNARVKLDTILGRDGQTWRSMRDIAWYDGRDLILLAHGMEVQARFCPGEWSEDTPISPREYSGAVWSCFDDQFQLEIEEMSHDPAEWWHGQVTHWRDLTIRPASVDERPKGQDTEEWLGAKPASAVGESRDAQTPSEPHHAD